ncbi:hypothetical protein ABZ686_22405 [Streptomyces sp. NPDC006992]|uniref:hypothetical protein n=1 Tax=Streptomyces sp. NPDC006992 TaxID=3155601 RepID=UPI003401AA51
MAVVCKEIREWIEEKVSRPVEEWEERTGKKCKKYAWYDPRGWFCWIVTILVKVVRWVLVTVGKWVTRLVCHVIAVTFDFFRDVLAGFWDVLAGIFTLNWRRILDGLIRVFTAAVLTLIQFVRIALLGELVSFIIDEINDRRIRDHVRKRLERKYSGETLEQIKKAIRLDHGTFGLRVHATAFRTVIDSQTPSPGDPNVPNLVALHEAGAIDLHELCGFSFPGYWDRKRYKTLKKEEVVGGGGGGEFDNPITEDELKEYLSSRGARGPAFTVVAMRDSVLDTKLTTAEEKGRELGLIFTFDRTTVPVVQGSDIVLPDEQESQVPFLTRVIGRANSRTDNSAAVAQHCRPVAVGLFRYTNLSRHGLATLLASSDCGLTGQRTSGITFTDNLPDRIWKYVLIHELGHYFGLCHADGLDRIMYQTEKTWITLRLPWGLYLKGEPEFTFDEEKAAWNYIVDNFSPQCLGAAAPPPSPLPPPPPPPPPSPPPPPDDGFRNPR